MNHFGKILKQHIENNHIVKGEVAKAVGITPNYLSTIYRKESIDASLMEKLCQATGLDISQIFELPTQTVNIQSGNRAHTEIGDAVVSISGDSNYKELLKEKDLRLAEMERTIRKMEQTIDVLLSNRESINGTDTEQNH